MRTVFEHGLFDPKGPGKSYSQDFVCFSKGNVGIIPRSVVVKMETMAALVPLEKAAGSVICAS